MGGRGEVNPVAGQTGFHPQRHSQMGLARPWRAEEDHVVTGIDE